MENAYELAKKAGYEGRLYAKSVNSEWFDPNFWSALGKSLGWKSEMLLDTAHGMKVYALQETWLYQWHCFIDHLAEGKVAEEFFNQLLK